MSICPKTGGYHLWFECFRQEDPPARVFDCACGARRKVFASLGGVQADIDDNGEIAPSPGGSVANCLVHVDGMRFIQQLGDPQSDRLRSAA